MLFRRNADGVPNFGKLLQILQSNLRGRESSERSEQVGSISADENVRLNRAAAQNDEASRQEECKCFLATKVGILIRFAVPVS